MNRVEEVVHKVRCLQRLTEQTGTITKRSQGLLLQSLSSEELIEAAEKLDREKDRHVNQPHQQAR